MKNWFYIWYNCIFQVWKQDGGDGVGAMFIFEVRLENESALILKKNKESAIKSHLWLLIDVNKTITEKFDLVQ